MKTRTLMSGLILAGILLCLAFSGPAWAEKGGKGGGGAKLKATFRDAGFNILTVAPDRIASDCRLGDLDASSCPYADGQANVSVGIGGNSNFILEVNKGTRDVYFNFTDCVSSSDLCPPNEPRFLAAGDVDAEVGTQLGTRARLLVVGLGNLAVGQSAALNAEFLLSKHIDRVDGEEEVWWVTYRSVPPEVCPAGSSGPLLGTRVDATTWVVEAGATNVACLHSFAARPQGDGSEEFHGAYLMPFRLTITTQP